MKMKPINCSGTYLVSPTGHDQPTQHGLLRGTAVKSWEACVGGRWDRPLVLWAKGNGAPPIYASADFVDQQHRKNAHVICGKDPG